MVGTAGSGPKDRIDAGDEASMKILCPSGGVPQCTAGDEGPVAISCMNIFAHF